MRSALVVGALACLIAGCSSASGPCDPVATEGPETLHLYVSNQSFEIDPVDIEVYVDGRQLVCDEFFVEGQHNWILHDLSLEWGEHSLRAEGNDGTTTFEETFELNGERWAVLDFWFYPGETEEFSFLIQEGPIGFA